MIDNLLVGLLTMVVCLVLQALLVAIVVQFYSRRQSTVLKNSFPRTLGLIIGVMVCLVLGNFIQMAIWAQLFVYLGEFESFSESLYHSAVNFSTLGYGDIVMSEQHRLLGPLQAINGVLMVGVSTAVVMAAIQDALARTRGKAGEQ